MLNSSSSSNVVWSMNYSNIVSSGVYTTSGNNTFSNNIEIKYIIKRCRQCKHAHSQEGGTGCYDVINASVAFVMCSCKEHVPEDNLEYLEYLSKKKESI
jgi:hypothetical protein